MLAPCAYPGYSLLRTRRVRADSQSRPGMGIDCARCIRNNLGINMGGRLLNSFFRHRVLIVDDDPAIREILMTLLEGQGYEVLTANDGFDGLTALKRSLPDVIISDLEMPNMSGFEFLAVVRRRFPGISVVVISGAFSGVSVPKSVLADAFLSKRGFQPEGLLALISKLIKELPARPKVAKYDEASVWVRNDKGLVVVTCSECLRTFPVLAISAGINKAECDFCSSIVSFEVIAIPRGAGGRELQ